MGPLDLDKKAYTFDIGKGCWKAYDTTPQKNPLDSTIALIRGRLTQPEVSTKELDAHNQFLVAMQGHYLQKTTFIDYLSCGITRWLRNRKVMKKIADVQGAIQQKTSQVAEKMAQPLVLTPPTRPAPLSPIPIQKNVPEQPKPDSIKVTAPPVLQVKQTLPQEITPTAFIEEYYQALDKTAYLQKLNGKDTEFLERLAKEIHWDPTFVVTDDWKNLQTAIKEALTKKETPPAK